jgi:hypothetical protein
VARKTSGVSASSGATPDLLAFLERRGYEVAALDSVIQMVLKLEAEEDTFDGMLVEVSAEMRENPSNFVRFVKETQAISRPVLLLNGWGSHDVMRAAQQEGFSAAIQPGTTQELLSRLRGLRMAKSQVSRSADSGDFCLRSERMA